MFEPPITESEAKSEGFELEDYETDIVEIWPDNERAYELFLRIGTRWMHSPMGGVPTGLRWEALYPLMDRLGLDSSEWNDLHECLMVMESEAILTKLEFAPKNE